MSITKSEFTQQANNAYISPNSRTTFAGFKMDLLENETIMGSANSTAHIVEDNSFINDHITVEPKKIMLSGIVSEIQLNNDISPEQQAEEHRFNNPPNDIVDKQDDDSTTQSQRRIEDAQRQNTEGEVLTPTGDVYSSVEGRITGTRQRKSLAFVQTLADNKILLSISTRVGFYPNMHIESFSMTTNQKTDTQSILQITFSELRFAKTRTNAVDAVALGRANALAQKLERGNANGKNGQYQSIISAGVSSIRN